ncbi:glucose PTS transporter subunit IIA, partial [Proteus mirabilis]
ADGYDEDIKAVPTNSKEAVQQEARQYIAAVGGSDNLTGIDACITRLRLNVKDASVVNDAYAKHLGASGVIRLNKQSVQVIVGTRAEIVASAMRDVLAQGPVAAYAGRHTDNAVSTEKTSEKQTNNDAKVILEMVAPFDGEVVALKDVPDEAFSSGVVGDGLAIKPTSNIVMAPAAGTVVKIFDTNHAFCIETDNGVEIIVHMGIDTVALGGKGFKRLVEEGTEVKLGQPILELDLEYLNTNAKSMISPVIISNIDDFDKVSDIASGQVTANNTIIYKVLK